MTLLSLLDQIGDHREVVAVAIDEGVSLKGTVWSPFTTALLSDKEGAIEDLHPPKAQRLPRAVKKWLSKDHLVKEVPLTLISQCPYTLGVGLPGGVEESSLPDLLRSTLGTQDLGGTIVHRIVIEVPHDDELSLGVVIV